MGDLNSIRNMKIFEDAILIHRDKEYPINSFLLASVSKTFFDFILGNQSSPYFELPPIRGNLNEFISLFYGQKININKDNMYFLHYLSIFFKINKLREEIDNYIVRIRHKFSLLVRFTNQLFEDGVTCDCYLKKILERKGKILKYKKLHKLSCRFLTEVFSPLIKTHQEVISTIFSLIRQNQNKFNGLLNLIDMLNLTPIMLMQLLNSNIDINQFKNYLIPCINNTMNVYSNNVRLFLPRTFIHVGMKGFLQSANDTQNIDFTQHTIDESSSGFDGLLAYFDKNNLLNNQSIVTLRGSPGYSPEYGLSKLLELKDTYSYYCSQADNGCIIFVFPHETFNLLYYAFRPWKNYKNGVFPSKWTVQIAQAPNVGPRW